MAKKYENKEEKKVTYMFNPYAEQNKKEYVCSRCGKKFVYDLAEIDAAEPSEARLIGEEKKQGEKEISTYLDMQMTEQATGIRLCKDCLQKEYENLVQKMYRETTE
jgi:DNA-directed RNA polymerase subunit RPC12/RpoP